VRPDQSLSPTIKNYQETHPFGAVTKAILPEDFPALRADPTRFTNKSIEDFGNGKQRKLLAHNRFGNSSNPLGSYLTVSSSDGGDALVLHHLASEPENLPSIISDEAKNTTITIPSGHQPPDVLKTNGKPKATDLRDLDLKGNATSFNSNDDEVSTAAACTKQRLGVDILGSVQNTDFDPPDYLVSADQGRQHDNTASNIGMSIVDMIDQSATSEISLQHETEFDACKRVNADLRLSPTTDERFETVSTTNKANTERSVSPSPPKATLPTREEPAPCVLPSSDITHDYPIPPSRNVMCVPLFDLITGHFHPQSDVMNPDESEFAPASTSRRRFSSRDDVNTNPQYPCRAKPDQQMQFSHAALPPTLSLQNFDDHDHQFDKSTTALPCDPSFATRPRPFTSAYCSVSDGNHAALSSSHPPISVNNSLVPTIGKGSHGCFSGFQTAVDDHTAVSTLKTSKSKLTLGRQTPLNTARTPYVCSLCLEPGFATLSTPLVLCPGCGPLCNIRYCSITCLLANAYDHSYQCMNFPASQRLAFHNLPTQFVYEKDPIMAINPWAVISAEQFRQKAFSMYGRFRPFSPVLKLGAEQNLSKKRVTGPGILRPEQVIGDYYVFRCATTVEPLENSKSDVIFVSLALYHMRCFTNRQQMVSLQNNNHLKGVLQRALNACYLLPQIKILEFVFRLIRSYILDDDIFKTLPHSAPNHVVFEEFKEQFSKEFDLDIETYEQEYKPFDAESALLTIMPLLKGIELRNPILQYWRRY
jgi:hypothetical protein